MLGIGVPQDRPSRSAVNGVEREVGVCGITFSDAVPVGFQHRVKELCHARYAHGNVIHEGPASQSNSEQLEIPIYVVPSMPTIRPATHCY